MIKDNLEKIKLQLPLTVQLVAVSKFRPIEQLREVYDHGVRDFAENRVQELCEKQETMPEDIQWHMIGHLQTNKVKYIAPFIHLIHSVDSLDLAKEISKQGQKLGLKIKVLIQFHIAQEVSKFGFDLNKSESIFNQIMALPNIEVCGLMGMATFTEDTNLIRLEFQKLNIAFNHFKETLFESSTNFNILSMGMSNDFMLAIEEGSTLVRIGSKIFE